MKGMQMSENSTIQPPGPPGESLLATRADGEGILFGGIAARILRGVLEDAEAYNADVAVDREGAAARARCAEALRGWMEGTTPNQEVNDAFTAMAELQTFIDVVGVETC
jgi:hypothetical protein